MEEWLWYGLGGNLHRVETLLYYDRPVILVMENTHHTRFLTQLIGTDEEADSASYLLFTVSEERLAAIKRGDVSLREATLNCETRSLWRVTVDEMDVLARTERLRPQDLFEEDLPTEDVRLGTDPRPGKGGERHGS